MEKVSIIYFLGIQFCFNNFLTKKFKYKGNYIYFVFTVGNDLFNIRGSVYEIRALGGGLSAHPAPSHSLGALREGPTSGDVLLTA